jgi:hypothetical protein
VRTALPRAAAPAPARKPAAAKPAKAVKQAVEAEWEEF